MKASNVYIWLVSLMVVWGVNVVALKVLVLSFDPVAMTSVRILFAGLSVLVFLYFMKQLRMPTRREFGVITGVGLFNVVGHHYFLSIGLTVTTAVNAGLILGLIPILTAVAAMIFLRARLTILKFIGIIIGFAGVSFVMMAGSTGGFSIAIGDLYIFLAALTQAISFVLIKKFSTDMSVLLLTGWMMVVGSFFLGAISLFSEPAGYISLLEGEGYQYVIFFASAILATCFGHMIYNNAIRLIGPSESAVFTNLNLLFSLLSAAILLKEQLYIEQLLGFFLIVIGVISGSGAIDHWLRTRRMRRSEVQ
ncbi:DMT family transporter [Jeotgalibacillus proteolyticus]|uniref:EamA family transporter n=1 Tax=Jeotgalibacillus proteolyticus TaxID=2082395 RepID=A0A2S5GCZ3_9BACL|nr:DMT family transporter [Jeotgalibacillus proteolyticus]PPA70763.1 EamA family transporter [Jeotgalibacillus proteolyticus]